MIAIWIFLLNIFIPVTGINASLPQQELQWVIPVEPAAKTVFYQGMFSSQTQATKYTGRKGFIATTGEHIYSTKGIPLIYDIVIAQELEDICLLAENKKWIDIFKAPMNALQGYFTYRSNESYGIVVTPQEEIILEEYEEITPSSTVMRHRFFFTRYSVGQESDIEQHQQKVNACDTKPKILFGSSKGAATTFDAYATNKYADIKLVVLEGCFDSLENVFQERYRVIPTWLSRSLYHALSYFTLHEPSGIAPIKLVDEFPKQSPVVFITSKKDTEVPSVCTKAVAQELVNAGHEQVYLLELQHSKHSTYMMDNDEDIALYLGFMHSLYKHYKLPYIAEYADNFKLPIESFLVSKLSK